MKNLCESKFWDSNTTWDTSNPDFTECSKNTALQWIPSIFLWVFLPLELYFLSTTKTSHNSYNKLNVTKLGAIICILGSSVVELGNNVLTHSAESLTDVLSPVFKMCSFTLFLLISWKRTKKGITTSGVSFFFSFLSIICGIPIARDVFQNGLSGKLEQIVLNDYIFVVYYSSMIVLFVLSCFGDHTASFSSVTNEKRCPSHESSFLSNLYLSWFTKYVLEGYKSPFKDILWFVDYQDSAAYILGKFEKIWNSTTSMGEQDKVDDAEGILLEKFYPADKKKTNYSIVGPISKLIWFQMLQTTFLKFLEICMSLSSPLIFSLLITTIDGKNEHFWKAYLCAFLFFVDPLVQAAVTKYYFEIILKVKIHMTNAIMFLVYDKTLKLSNEARKHYSSGAIINLISIDVSRICVFVENVNHIWSAPMQMAITFYFLWNYFGTSVIAAIITIIILFLINSYAVGISKKLRIQEMNVKGKRCQYLQEILSGVKVLKMYAWESSFEKIVKEMRKMEMKYLKKLAILQTVLNLFFNSTHFTLPLVTFAIYLISSSDNALNVEKAFISISFFNILRIPIYQIPALFDFTLQAFVSIKRINEFLNLEEIDQSAVSHENIGEALLMENGKFAWEKNQDSVTLENINLQINKGSLVAIVGQVGSGKSSLISAFLGELPKISGHVNVNGSTAYVPQQAWILNRTVKENIILDNTVDEKLYVKALEGCALNVDLQSMPNGDQTEIGEKGINLSGGQKQRLSLARAVCSDKDIYFFDEPLSAVDSTVAEYIFRNVLGPQSMLQKKTRVVVTHSTAFLPSVDYIVVMKNGRISEKGTYEEIIRNNEAFAEFLNTNDRDLNKQTDANENEFNEKMSDHAVKKTISNVDEAGQKNSTSISKDSKKLIQKERTELGNIKFEVYKFYMKMGGFVYVFSIIFFHTAFQGFLVLSNMWLAKWSTEEKNLSRPGTDLPKSDDRFFNLGIYFILSIFQALALVLANSSMQAFLLKASKTIHNRLLENVLRWPMYIFDSTPIGRIINRFTSDIDAIDNNLAATLSMALIYSGRFVAALAVIMSSTPICAVFIVPAIFLVFIIQKYYMVVSHQLKRIDSVNKSPLYSHFVETISGLESIRAYNVQDKFIKKTFDKYDSCSATAYSTFVCSRWLSIHLEILTGIIHSLISFFVISKRDILSEGIVAFIITFTMQISKEVQKMINNSTRVENIIVSVERIKEFIDEPREADRNSEMPSNWPAKGEIKFENINLRYRTGLDLVLKNVNFHIRAEEKVGIIGRTGAGKTSIISALFRMVEHEDGKILIDEVDISTVNLHKLRTKLTVIPQDPVLFLGTLRFNLDPFHAYQDDTIWNALEKAHLKDFVRNLPDALYYEIKDGGGNLSFGQKQLICLARALLRKTKILVLDEATASVDLKTDELIQNTIRNEFAQCTVITIAHRLNTVKDYDKILVMENGTVKEFDSTENLLQNKDSIFYSLAIDAGMTPNENVNSKKDL